MILQKAERELEGGGAEAGNPAPGRSPRVRPPARVTRGRGGSDPARAVGPHGKLEMVMHHCTVTQTHLGTQSRSLGKAGLGAWPPTRALGRPWANSYPAVISCWSFHFTIGQGNFPAFRLSSCLLCSPSWSKDILETSLESVCVSQFQLTFHV